MDEINNVIRKVLSDSVSVSYRQLKVLFRIVNILSLCISYISPLHINNEWANTLTAKILKVMSLLVLRVRPGSSDLKLSLDCSTPGHLTRLDPSGRPSVKGFAA